MDFIIELLVNAGVLFMIATIIPGISVKNYGTAVIVCLLVGILNATIGFFLRLPLNLITLFLLTFIVRLLVTAILIKLAGKLLKGFEVRAWSDAFILAICMAVASAIIDKVL